MDLSYLLTLFGEQYAFYLPIKDLFKLSGVSLDIKKILMNESIWKKKYLSLFKENTITQKNGYRNTLRLFFFSNNLCCICLKSLWKEPKEKNYLHICDCAFSGIFLRSHHECIKKHIYSNIENETSIEYMNCPFCFKRKKMCIPIHIFS